MLTKFAKNAIVLASVTLIFAAGCSSKSSGTKKAATGSPSGTSSKPSQSAPTPSTKVNSTVTGDTTDAADYGETCDQSEEGLGACLDDYVVFCTGGEVYALDCSTFTDGTTTGTCSTLDDGSVDCVFIE